MTRWVTLLLLSAWVSTSAEAACSGSSPTWTAANATRTEVAACVTAASPGDTINVPSGNGGSWASAIAITKDGLKLIGAGIGSTTISARSFHVQADNVEISGFSMTSMLDGLINDGLQFTASQNLNFHHNSVVCTDWNQWIEPRTDATHTQMPTGVFHHNDFKQCRWVIQADWGGESYSSESGAKGWAASDPLGTANALFFEDNTAEVTDCAQGNAGVSCNWIDAHSGSAVVVRFNTIVNTYLEIHPGLWPGHRGARLMEVYGNTLDCNFSATVDGCNGFRRPGLMKGNSFWWGNQATAAWGNNGSITMTDDRGAYVDNAPALDDCDGTSFVDGNTSPSGTYHGWPCRDSVGQSTDATEWDGTNPSPAQVHRPNYHFGNTESGGAEWDYDVAPLTGVVDQIVNDRDFFGYVAGFNGTTGIGQGTLASRPATCTTNPSGTARTSGWGPGYWCTNCGSWNTSTSNPRGVNMNGQDGVLYVCTATNTWTVKYTPYTYPHPLQSGGGGSSTGGSMDVRNRESDTILVSGR